MTVSKGEIWLADLNPVKRNNEVGKKRPVLIFQSDALNHSAYSTTMILPLSTDRIDHAEPLRVRITQRERLHHDSDVLIAQIRAIDNARLIELLASVTPDEYAHIKSCFLDLIDE
jgi:mRNA interferase MazF